MAMLTFVLACAGCPRGERCDMSSYERGCDGNSAYTYCADKLSDGMKKLWPTVVRIECQAHTECVEDGTITTCVAAPAERCDSPDAERCVDEMTQRCWELGGGLPPRSGVYYWHFVGLSCEP